MKFGRFGTCKFDYPLPTFVVTTGRSKAMVLVLVVLRVIFQLLTAVFVNTVDSRYLEFQGTL